MSSLSPDPVELPQPIALLSGIGRHSGFSKISGLAIHDRQASLYLMGDRFSPKQIYRRRRQTLINILKRLGMSNADKVAA